MIRKFNIFIIDTGIVKKNENIFPRMILEAQFIYMLMGYSKISQENKNTNVLKYGTKYC